ncbi:IucA/IucC family C-terminal-domain containing protein [Streptomyces brasiliensis]|uniref:IucA/IucC family C-terminal-domain containing protein n=1 Tax=Streptomyces brasiliensis TaxID=1954 RepID=UPI001E337D37|nr:IucA/IucC family C-terminal-domain containing protein [Streptomyces brasiliensis]
MDLAPDLAALRPLGGFFVLRTTGATGARREPPGGPLPTLAEIYENPGSDVYGRSLAFRVELVADRIRAAELRVSVSVAQQALAARLWSVALGCAALYGRVPDLAPRLLRWDPAATAPEDLWLTEVRPLPGDAATLVDTVLAGHLEPLVEALHTRYGVATGLLWGNAGSALAGAARELARWARAHGRADVAHRTRTLTADLFTHPLLSGTGTFTGTAFRRRSCCLYYRVPDGGVCGDCCFTRPPRSSPRAPSG